MRSLLKKGLEDFPEKLPEEFSKVRTEEFSWELSEDFIVDIPGGTSGGILD